MSHPNNIWWIRQGCIFSSAPPPQGGFELLVSWRKIFWFIKKGEVVEKRGKRGNFTVSFRKKVLGQKYHFTGKYTSLGSLLIRVYSWCLAWPWSPARCSWSRCTRTYPGTQRAYLHTNNLLLPFDKNYRLLLASLFLLFDDVSGW